MFVVSSDILKFSIQLGCVQWDVWDESVRSNKYICRHTFFSPIHTHIMVVYANIHLKT